MFSSQHPTHTTHVHDLNDHALLNYLDHYYTHVLDQNGDGCVTLSEELTQFNSEDSTPGKLLLLIDSIIIYMRRV